MRSEEDNTKKAYLHIPGITGTGTKLHHGWIEVIQDTIETEHVTFRFETVVSG